MTLQKHKGPFIAASLALLLTPILAACSAADEHFPSLAKRPYENDDPLAIPVEAPVAVAASLPAALAAQVKDLESRHQKAQAAFNQLQPGVSATVTRSAKSTTGSEAWANANVQLTRLDNARSDSVKVLGEIDVLVEAQRTADSQSNMPVIAPLLEARQKVIGDDVDKQNAEINRLSALIS